MPTYTDNALLMASSQSYATVDQEGSENYIPNTKMTSSGPNACVRRISDGHLAGNHFSSNDRSFASSPSSSSSSLKSSRKMSKKLSAIEMIKEKIAQKWETRNQRVSLFEAWQRKLPTLERPTDARPVENHGGFATNC